MLVKRHGSQAKVAQRLGKTGAFVSQRLALLRLVPDLQSAVQSGDLRLEDARDIGRLPEAEQMQAWQVRCQALGDLPNGQPAATPHTSASSSPDVNAVKISRKGPRVVRIEIGEPTTIAAQLRAHLSPTALAELARLIA